ncbi:hypothetical protein M406DRAFT_71588 [Cryphonectria parasitica EP155]|uniref:Uncharacterized protein n=1 Tax=Cryphonectria parasitica (strain ATCC 38755 / EP155) TaxID=660469 RepID=A0A9P4Y9M9_CRYP1|nr:uncharacterized protein M406DRAFT_71588 [Cryphonectria parasitica EP155]KAF3768600.1 hypothetical protein M406DRAFT_71588 [Cryphonectria parasitica EP155]
MPKTIRPVEDLGYEYRPTNSENPRGHISIPGLSFSTLIAILGADIDSGTVTVHEALNHRDQGRALKLRDMIMSFWRYKAGQSINNLKVIKYDTVMEYATLPILERIFDNYSVDGLPVSITATESSSSRRRAFNDLLRKTPFGQGAKKMLREYAELRGRRVISFLIEETPPVLSHAQNSPPGLYNLYIFIESSLYIVYENLVLLIYFDCEYIPALRSGALPLRQRRNGWQLSMPALLGSFANRGSRDFLEGVSMKGKRTDSHCQNLHRLSAFLSLVSLTKHRGNQKKNLQGPQQTRYKIRPSLLQPRLDVALLVNIVEAVTAATSALTKNTPTPPKSLCELPIVVDFFPFPIAKMASDPNSQQQANGDHEQQQQGPREARWSQYVENQINPMPEVAVDHDCAPEPVNLEQVDCTDDTSSRSVRPVIQPDMGDRRSATVVYAEPDRSWIARHKSWVIASLVLVVIVLTGVTVGVVMMNRQKGSGGGSPNKSSTSTPAPSTRVTSTLGSTTTSADSSPTATPSGCVASNFVTKVSWMGIAGVMGNWDVQYPGATDAASCCLACYENTRKGCDGWSFIPGASGSTVAACAVIDGWAGTRNDTACPLGYTGVQFSQQGDNASHVGGPGPCATIANPGPGPPLPSSLMQRNIKEKVVASNKLSSVSRDQLISESVCRRDNYEYKQRGTWHDLWRDRQPNFQCPWLADPIVPINQKPGLDLH